MAFTGYSGKTNSLHLPKFNLASSDPAVQIERDLSSGDTAAVLNRLQEDPSLQSLLSGEKGAALLLEAVRKGQEAMVRFLLERGLTANPIPDADGATLLHLAAGAEASGAVASLLQHGAAVNARAKNGVTPLYVAVNKGRLETVRLLLDRGADVEAADEDGNTPLMVVVIGKQNEIVQLLLERRANTRAANLQDLTPLHAAATNGNQGCGSHATAGACRGGCALAQWLYGVAPGGLQWACPGGGAAADEWRGPRRS